MAPPRRSERDVVSGRRSVLELLRSDRPVERLLLSRTARPSPVVKQIRSLAAKRSVPTRLVPPAELDAMAAGGNHQGVLAVTGAYRYRSIDRVLDGAQAVLFLDGVMDPHNLGSLLRSADGAGFNGVVIPMRRSTGVTAAVRRVSAGASERVPVARVSSLRTALQTAKASGLWVVGLDPLAEEDLWSSKLLESPVGVVLGAEDKGLSAGIRALCDGFVRIPLRGTLESLNVAVAGALAMFEVARRANESATL